MIYLDTSAFYFLFFEDAKYTKMMKKIFARINSGKEEAITSSLTLDEIAYIILMRLVERKYKKHPKEILRERPKIILEFVEQIQNVFQTIFSIKNLEIVEVDRNIAGVVPLLMEEHSLLPRDCIHLETMRKFNIKKILTTDEDFDRIQDIERAKF